MLTYLQAQQLLLSRACSFGSEFIHINEAAGRVLAEPITADRDYPPFNRSAMDGYALRFSDYENGIRDYQIAETIYAGQMHQIQISTAQCYKIMTGAAVPDFADMVVRREDTIEQSKVVTVKVEGGRRFQHMSLQAEDLNVDQVVLTGANLCTAQIISLLAAFGKQVVAVEKLPTVGLFTTGNEVVPLGEPVNLVQIRNSNRYLLTALLKKWHVDPQIIQHIPDDKEQLYRIFEKAMDLDMIIVSGGVSAGDADFVPEVMQGLGVEKLFYKLAIKPGKPIWCGERKNGCTVFALPGNPFSCQVTFTLFVETYLRASFGLPPLPLPGMPILQSRTKKAIWMNFFLS